MDVAKTLKWLRVAARLSQKELAGRAHTSQPAVNRYERGEVVPSLATFERLVEACGHRLAVEPSDAGRGPLAELVQRNRRTIVSLARRRGGSNVRLFGSVARGDESAGSDVDLLVDLPAGRTLLDLSGLRLDLEEALGVEVDVATERLLKEPVRRRAIAEAKPL